MMLIDHKFIGKEYEPDEYEIGREKMKEYANAVGDMNPYYHDKAFGKESKYKDNIAPPCFASVYNLLGCGKMFLDPELKINFAMLVHGEQEFEFVKPVKPGDLITTTGRIADIYEKGKNDFIVFEGRSTNQNGELVAVGRATFVIRGGN
ncbi:MAG: MaoC family dehydratase N-terminal domain-containing protein [Actinomycetota bacterium]|nr:MaoC family dehydratase N-terminal domain-containing protein [Actinomycetota bacterium]